MKTEMEHVEIKNKLAEANDKFMQAMIDIAYELEAMTDEERRKFYDANWREIDLTLLNAAGIHDNFTALKGVNATSKKMTQKIRKLLGRKP